MTGPAIPLGNADVEQAILALLSTRRPGTTICPSEVARRLAPADGDDWRQIMPAVHGAATRLARRGAVDIRQRGRSVDPAERTGAYRIARVEG